jgi:hypothetical protein
MLNRLPDRGSDTSRQIGDFQGVQSALARATGYASWHDDEGTRLTIGKTSEGKNDYALFLHQAPVTLTAGPRLLEHKVLKELDELTLILPPAKGTCLTKYDSIRTNN